MQLLLTSSHQIIIVVLFFLPVPWSLTISDPIQSCKIVYKCINALGRYAVQENTNLNNLFRFYFCYLTTDDLQISQEVFYQPTHDCTAKESPYFRGTCRPIVCWKMYRCNLGMLKDSVIGYFSCGVFLQTLCFHRNYGLICRIPGCNFL